MNTIVENLEFEPLGDNAPSMTCNFCGKPTTAGNKPQMATIYPFEDESDHFSATVCSDECKEKYLAHPNVDHYLLEQLVKICNNFGQEFNDEYMDYYDRKQEEHGRLHKN